MPFHLPLTNLNGGELSPFLDARVDIAKYATGLQTLENFLILPYGGIIRRPGTEFLGEAKYADRTSMLFGFNFSTTTSFVIEFGDNYCRFWSNGVQVRKGSADDWVTSHAYVVGDYVSQSGLIYYCLAAHTSGTFATDLAAAKWVQQDILEVPTNYQQTDLRSLQFCPVNDVIYITNPSYPVSKLKRVADDNWTFGAVVWTYPPTLDENIENITITPSATTGTITLTASSAIFKPGHVGSYWVIGHPRSGNEASYVQVALAAVSGGTNGLTVLGSWEFTTYGSWQGTVKVNRFIPGAGTNTEVIRTYTNSVVNERNVTATGNEEKETTLQILWTGAGVAGTNGLARLEVGQARYYGFVKITAFTSSTVVTASVVKPLYATTATVMWSEGASSAEQGHFRTVALHEGRLMLGGTAKQPLRLYGSFIDDFENFITGSNTDNSIAFRITSNESNPIQWMISQQGKLIIGTAAEEIDFGRSDDNEALGPTNVHATRQSSYGSAFIQAKLINEVIMFVQRQGKKVREYVFAFEKDTFVGPDLTVLANHVSGTRSSIVELAFQQQPDATLWAVTSAQHHIATMTYERDQNVVGWSRQTTVGPSASNDPEERDSFESVATIYGGSGPDEVWFVLARIVNGQVRRYIERMHSAHRDDMEAEDKEAYWYLDSAKKGVFGSLTASVSGLSHLEGRTVGVYADGGAQPDQVVSGGGIDLETPARNILVGLRYTSTARPQKFNIPSQDGSVIGRRGRVHIATLRLYKSMGLEYSSDEENWTAVTFRRDGDSMDASPPVFTGDQRLVVDGGYDTSAHLTLRSSEPFPLCILAIVPEVDYHGT